MKKYLILFAFLISTSASFGQIRIIKVVPSTNTITVKNFGTTEVNISGYRLCSLIKYTSNLTTGITINNGDMNLSAGEEVEFVAQGGASSSWQNLQTNADLGLYLSSGSFGSAANMVDFVQWGSAGNGRESVANSKGIWASGDFVTGDEPYTYTGDGAQNGVGFWTGVTGNNSPTDIILNSNSIAENNSINAVIGTFSTIDADEDSHTYALVAGDGDNDNTTFDISGSNLITKEEFNFETQASYSIRIETNDGNGGTFSKSFIITITDVIEIPTDIALSNQTISENNAIGDVIGSFSTIDEDAGETYSYEFVTGTGSTDNSSFQIVNDELRANEIFDAEMKSTYSIRVITNDGNDNTFEKSFNVTITGQNEQPIDISLSNNTLSENEASGFIIGSISTSDPDTQDAHTYSFVSGSGDADNASFSINGSELLADEVFNFEVKNLYSIRVQSQDNSGATFSKEFAISITNKNEAPTAIFISSNVICFGDIAGFEIGSFSSEDEDANETFTYSFVTGNGDDHNALFTISNEKLLLNTTVTNDLGPFLLIRVKSEDAGNLSFESKFQINIEGDPILGLANPNITVYPNPFIDVLKIELGAYSDEVNISITDLLGKTWLNQIMLIEDGILSINKINIPNGFYVLNISKDEEVIISKRILKQE